MYEPAEGEILVDGQPLRRIRTEDWRAKVSGAFQDFHRFEFQARTSVGVGDLPLVADDAAVHGAVQRAGATDVVDGLASGLDTQLGSTWPTGVDVSFGQWQKLALARGFMREAPLLLVLDEPTAALDAETEHALFSRYASVARSTSVGGITLLVSHRFSTVRMADLIVVLQGSAVVQVGSHDELIGQPGTYAELYAIQAGAYR
jgi:ATP-binding cassette subfamily B protein